MAGVLSMFSLALQITDVVMQQSTPRLQACDVLAERKSIEAKQKEKEKTI